jgi:F0F1-type ATP synthase gamma subunit
MRVAPGKAAGKPASQLSDLTLEMNVERHAAITQEPSDVSADTEAMG